jgi:hypothetical protein
MHCNIVEAAAVKSADETMMNSRLVNRLALAYLPRQLNRLDRSVL